MKPSEAAARLRGATTDADRDRARNELAAAIRNTAALHIARRGLRPADAADVAQDVTVRVLDWIERGDVEHGREDAYVRRVAFNSATDHHRRRIARRKREVLGHTDGWEEGVPTPDVDDPESAAVEREERATARVTAQRLIVLIEKAPVNYKHVLVQYYLHNTSLERLADEEFQARVRSGTVHLDDPADVARHRKQARNLIDARLSRARRWLQHRFASDEQEARS